MSIEISELDSIIIKQGLKKNAVIPALLAIQEEYNYVPPEAIERVAEQLDVPLMQVYQVVSFYKVFSLEPRGKHTITVCLGTACHVRGSNFLLDQVERVLSIKPGETSEDRQFTLEAVNCLGVCALGPVMVIDGKYFGNMNVSKVERVINKFRDKEVVADEE
jgi:NADH-quinone oxidoreductase subunit E